jgi:hypothetical protein
VQTLARDLRGVFPLAIIASRPPAGLFVSADLASATCAVRTSIGIFRRVGMAVFARGLLASWVTTGATACFLALACSAGPGSINFSGVTILRRISVSVLAMARKWVRCTSRAGVVSRSGLSKVCGIHTRAVWALRSASTTRVVVVAGMVNDQLGRNWVDEFFVDNSVHGLCFPVPFEVSVPSLVMTSCPMPAAFFSSDHFRPEPSGESFVAEVYCHDR